MVADGLLAALLTLIAIPQLFLPSDNFERLYAAGFRDPGVLAVLLTLGQTVPLAWRRRAPYAVLAAVTAAAFAHLAFGFKPTFAEAAMVVALYTVAAHRPRRQALVAALLFGVTMAGYGVIAEARYPSSFEDSLQAWALTFIQFGAAFFLGDLQQRRLATMAKLEALNTQLAAEQELRARWAVAAERARIARELHDVVAHSVSVMVVQAGAARRTLATSPGQATTALGQIESTGRQALVEMRRLLGLLRDGDGEDGEDGEAAAAALSPQPSLAHLESLAAAAREAGLPVEIVIEGEPRPLPAGVDLSAYRIVQEALTNSLKHAGPARASVRLCYGREALEVQVLDDGPGPGPAPVGGGLAVVTLGPGGVLSVGSSRPTAGGGHGLIGMRERVALFGGTLEAGPRPGGGYRVAAHLPLSGEPG